MTKSVDDRIRSLIALYDRGAITDTELSRRIAANAIDPRFFDHLDMVPDDVMLRLRKIAQHTPAHPEDCLIIQSINAHPGFDFEEHDRVQREIAYWSGRRLREYFYPNELLPEFQPLKFAGVVDDAIEIDRSVVIFGDLLSYLIRKNPIQLIAPTGARIITSATEMGWIKRDCDLKSSDPIIKGYGRHGVYLDRNVKSPLDTPPATELWVDRTAVAELVDPRGS